MDDPNVKYETVPQIINDAINAVHPSHCIFFESVSESDTDMQPNVHSVKYAHEIIPKTIFCVCA